MDSFKSFLKKAIPPILITTEPVHGSHAYKPPILITTEPVHGSHASKQANRVGIKEDSHSDNWKELNDNEHLGKNSDEITDRLHNPKIKEHEHFHHVYRYTEGSDGVNRGLISKATTGSSILEARVKDHADAIKELKAKGAKPDHPAFAQHEHLKAVYERKVAESKKQVSGIDKVISDHGTLNHDLHVYHGANFDPGDLAKKHPDGHIKSPCYLSTSHRKKTAQYFAAQGHGQGGYHILHIHLKKGQKALPILKHSEVASEHEHLLPRNTVLKVHPKPKKLLHGTHIWHATVHSQE